jgi:hypothetical protein
VIRESVEVRPDGTLVVEDEDVAVRLSRAIIRDRGLDPDLREAWVTERAFRSCRSDE